MNEGISILYGVEKDNLITITYNSVEKRINLIFLTEVIKLKLKCGEKNWP